MLSAEYDRMAAVEDRHWWYRGLRDLLRRVLQQRRSELPEHPCVLDAGCGTGANLQLLAAEMQPQSLLGFDIAEQAVQHARRNVPEANIVVDDLRHPQLAEARLDLILCVDVIYMTGLEPALPGLQSLVARLPAGGWLLLHAPAYNWLYSRHDVAVGTRQRFTRREIGALLDRLGLRCELLTYRMCLLFPLVVLSRLPSLLGGARRANQTVQSDLGLPPRWLNAGLEAVVAWENWLIVQGVRFPWGSSLLAVGRKP